MERNLEIFANNLLTKLHPTSVKRVLEKRHQVVYQLVTDGTIQYLKIINSNRKKEIEMLKLFEFTPQVVDLYQENDYIAFILSNAGTSLSSFVKNNFFEFPQFVQFIKLVLQCLIEIHGNGHVHLDINPGNICLSDNAVSIIDFGLTEKMENGYLPGGYRYGIPRYKAPEIVKNGPPIDESVDVYAFGKIIIELVQKKAVNLDEEQKEFISRLSNQMIASNPKERISPDQILEMLNEFIPM
ncbi:hypothetical protein HDV06_006277 [Boothiomyces sp. JEL0866]|nr:hypothetical protein HDV06_006734 [Boothiomyces sp. JEL0866]KAJ3319467.1 hypothetical protein HDV06_006277 [Boothiomyces sp. JEL0866]